MPLLDHFHPPLLGERRWESFHSQWAGSIAAFLNQARLPPGCFAEVQISFGGLVEIDVATLDRTSNSFPRSRSGTTGGGTAVLTLPTYSPPIPALVMPAVFPDEVEVRVIATDSGPTLVAALELVSPSDKDRPETRRAFATKCASYLHEGIGLVVVDVVTSRLANLHDELIEMLRLSATFVFPHQSSLYAVAYRPARRNSADEIDTWFWSLTVGKDLPRVPLALRNLACVEVDLESAYSEARQRSQLA